MIEHKIEQLIEEAGIASNLKKLIQRVGIIPSQIIDKIKKKFNIINIEENTIPKPAVRITGETDNRDTCYTAIMKLINQKRLITKYPTLYDFMEAYSKKQAKPIEVKDININNLKPGTIMLLDRKMKPLSSVNRTYGDFGIGQKKETVVGHIFIYIGKDKLRKDKPYVILHNALLGDDRIVSGTGLELKIDYRDKKWFNKKDRNHVKKILDFNIIKGL